MRASRVVAPILAAMVGVVVAMVVAPAAAPADPSPATASASAEHPDIIVILTDDQRGGTEKAMPFTWSFFRSQGVHYPRAEVPTNLCCPSRAGLFTGEYSHTTGVWDNDGYSGGYRAFSRWQGPTLPLRLQQAGYQTSLFGKYFNYYGRDGGRGLVPPGWDVFHTWEFERKGLAYRNQITGLPSGYVPDVLTDAAVAQIRGAAADRPQFILYSTPAPHAPFDAGPYAGAADRKLLRKFRRAGQLNNPSFREADVRDKPQWIRRLNPSARTLRSVADKQSEALMGVDANVERILQAQGESRDLANTVVVYLTDNGYAWGEHRLRLKQHPYRLTSRIPLLVKYPAGVGAEPAGSTSRRLVNQLDVTATLAELSGTAPLGQGRSLLGPPRESLPLEAGPSEGGVVRRPAYCGVRTAEFLYLKYADGTREFYDYRNDPYELRNRAGSRRYLPMLRQARALLDPGCDLARIRNIS